MLKDEQFRVALIALPKSQNTVLFSSNLMDTSRVTLVFVTIGRDKAAIDLVRSVRHLFPNLRILVADQNGPTEEMEQFYTGHRVRILWLPWDCGLSFARNRAVELVETDYILLADDDFIFTQETRLHDAIQILESLPEIGFLGGSVIDVIQNEHGDTERRFRKWEKHLILLEAASTLISIPIDHLPLQVREVADKKVYLCDMTSNWGIFRRQVFDYHQWDEAIKINGEHEDFFLGMKVHTNWKVAYFPGLICDHQQVRNPSYRGLRYRLDGRTALGKKWNLSHHLELGVGLRNFANYLAYSEVPLSLSEVYEAAMNSTTGVLKPPKSIAQSQGQAGAG